MKQDVASRVIEVALRQTDELTKLERLKSEKAISDQEYARLRARILQ